jgi:predicted tellurium resistance membrane protein TerC
MLESIIELASSSHAWVALVALTFMEVILGIDNIIFISIVANKLPESLQGKARKSGLLIAMFMRIVLLLGLSILLENMDKTWFVIDFLGLYAKPNGQAVILVIGGLFLLYKTIKEIHHKLEGHDMTVEEQKDLKKTFKYRDVVIQISLINMVFSVDSILTAVGMTQDLTKSGFNALPVMVLGVIFSVLIMMQFAGPIGNYINKHPSVQMLALSFLVLISFMLLAEGSHAAHGKVGDFVVEAIPKGYLYFAIAFSTIVQLLIIRMQKRSDPVKLHGPIKEAEEQDILD